MEEGDNSKSMMRTRIGQWLTDLVSRAETGIPVTKVFRLYQEDFGEHFPMRKLGCWNPVKALESLPEYVYVEAKPETGEKLIFPPRLMEVTAVDTTQNSNDQSQNQVNDNLDYMKKPMLKPHRGTFQLTFINHFQLEKSVLLDYFHQQQGFIGANILSGLKRRCFVSYKREQDALDALDNLKGNETLVELDVADDCKMENYDDQVLQNLEEEIPEMYACRGTFQLSFTTTKFINIGDISSIFSTYGHVSEVCSNFRKIKGRARVFVKYTDKIQAITVLRQLRDQFDDLGVANCCQKDAVKEVPIPVGKDGTFSVRFKNVGPMGEIFRRQEIYQMFGQFGEVVGVKTDLKFWTYIKYSSQEEAMAAYQEFSLAQNLPCFGVAEQKDDPNNTSYVKKTKFEVEENEMEIFISNFPAKIGVNKLRKIFTNFKEIKFREFKVNLTKAFCFAQLPDYEEMKRAVRELHGSIHYNRNLIVRAKIQEVHERIEAELLEEMTSGRDMMTSTGEDWEAEATDDNIYYDESVISMQDKRDNSPDEYPASGSLSSQPIPTITGNRPTENHAASPPKTVPTSFDISPPPIVAPQPKLLFLTPPPIPNHPPPAIKHTSHAEQPFNPFKFSTPTAAPPSSAAPSQQFTKPHPFSPTPLSSPVTPTQHLTPPPTYGVSQPAAPGNYASSPATAPSTYQTPPPVVTQLTASTNNFTQPPPPLSFNQPPPPILAKGHAPTSWRRPVLIASHCHNQNLPRPSLTKPPQRQSFICHNPSLRVAGIKHLSQPLTRLPSVSVSQDSGYNSNLRRSSMVPQSDNLSEIKISVDNNLFAPEKISRKRKAETEARRDPLRDEGIELVLANFAEGTSGADIFKLLEPFNVAGVNMAVNKLTPNDDFTFCFVRFSTKQEAEEAIEQLDGKPLLKSNQIVLEFA